MCNFEHCSMESIYARKHKAGAPVIPAIKLKLYYACNEIPHIRYNAQCKVRW
jgi:hypothetical protein